MNKKIIIQAVIIIVVFAVGFGAGYLFGKSQRFDRFGGASNIPNGFQNSRNSGNKSDERINNIRPQTGNQAPETTQQEATQGE